MARSRPYAERTEGPSRCAQCGGEVEASEWRLVLERGRIHAGCAIEWTQLNQQDKRETGDWMRSLLTNSALSDEELTQLLREMASVS
jgi:hypothetical protein